MKIKNLVFSKNKIKKGHLVKHETKKNVLVRFLLLLTILLVYTFFLSYKYGFATGGLAAILSWSFFVLCTPIADAGFLLDFPLRLFFHVRMVFSEIMVWVIAISLNAYCLAFSIGTYDKTFLTSILKKILINPNPYWLIVLISAVGTFVSVVFGDEMMDVVTHKQRKRYIKHGAKMKILIMIVIFGLVFVAYKHLADSLGISR